jgi:arylsulfatase A-like enzyme
VILLDDVGFGMSSTFGGPVATPHLDGLAKNGLKYTRFHTTALCSPTRAALLAGRDPALDAALRWIDDTGDHDGEGKQADGADPAAGA